MSLEREHVTNVLTKDKVGDEAQLISARFTDRQAMIIWGAWRDFGLLEA